MLQKNKQTDNYVGFLLLIALNTGLLIVSVASFV